MWQSIVAGLIFQLLASVLFKPKTQTRPPAGLSELKLPDIGDGEISVLFGCRHVRGIKILWYGNLSTTPIRVKNGKK